MTLGKLKNERQQDLFVTYDRLPRSPGHVFYRRLNQLPAAAGFDRWVENRCEAYTPGKGGRHCRPACTFGCCSSVTSK